MTLNLQTVQNQRLITQVSALSPILLWLAKAILLIVVKAIPFMVVTQWNVMKMELYQQLRHV